MKKIKESDENAIPATAQHLNEGGIIIFKSDTVFALAVDAKNEEAVDSLYKIKQRGKNKPFAIMVKNLEKAEEMFVFNKIATKLANKFFPGKLTMILPKKKNCTQIAKNVNDNDKSIGFRIIKNDFIEKLFEEFDGNLVATSANITNQKTANSLEEINSYFGNNDSNILLITNDKDSNTESSTVIKVIDNRVAIIREGAIERHLILRELEY